MTVAWQGRGQVLHHGDCLDLLPELADSSVDAVVTDPPYGLEFMGKEWDRFAGKVSDRDFKAQGSTYQAWCEQWARECLRVLKPGGHLLAFGGTRTWHRLVCAIEDAGFEIRDSLDWIYGQGFPKSLDVGKAIDKAAGAQREVTGCDPTQGHYDGSERRPVLMLGRATYAHDAYSLAMTRDKILTAPATEDAAQWEGWGTALKPAHEPVALARKPMAGGVAGNVLEHGTGALNIDACRVGMTDGDRAVVDNRSGANVKQGTAAYGDGLGRESGLFTSDPGGRWPPNVLLTHAPGCQPAGTRRANGNARPDRGTGGQFKPGSSPVPCGPQYGVDGAETVEAWDCAPGCPVAGLDAQSGTLTSGAWNGVVNQARPTQTAKGGERERSRADRPTDTGGASRFLPVTAWDPADLGFAFRYHAKAAAAERPGKADPDAEPHATVKPLGVMLWLAKLVTPPGGTVLDPFAGTGTTLEACAMLGFHGVGMEKYAASCALAVERLEDVGGRDRRIRASRPRPRPAGALTLFDDGEVL